MTKPEPHNPFYLLLLLASMLFVMTALGYGLLPFLEEKAAEMGQVAQPSSFRKVLAADGWKWLFYELIAMTLFGVLSMGLDRLRSLQKVREEARISPSGAIHSTSTGDDHGHNGTAD